MKASLELKWPEKMPTNVDLDYWIEHNLNVLLIGNHGVGKTAMVKEAFSRHSLNFKYFSAATMDPWVDFVGVPKEQQDKNGSYLELVRPKEFRDDTIEVLFFDEYNRAPKKVQNAVMELIQFKTINGRAFPNLRMVWAAINENTDDGPEYSTEDLDFAQLDRFHIIMKIPNVPQITYFKAKFKDDGEIACTWWKSLSPELKNFISPRRLEYVLQLHQVGGDIRQVLPSNCGANSLQLQLKNGSPTKILDELIEAGDKVKLRKWLNVNTNFSQVVDCIASKKEYTKECLGELTLERQAQLVTEFDQVKSYVETHPKEFLPLLTSFAGFISPLKKKKRQSDMRTWAQNALQAQKGLVNEADEIAYKAKPIPACLSNEINIINRDWKHLTDYMQKYIKYTEQQSPLAYHENLALEEALKASQDLLSGRINPQDIDTAFAILNSYLVGRNTHTLRRFWTNKVRNQFGDLLAMYITQTQIKPKDFFQKYPWLFRVMEWFIDAS